MRKRRLSKALAMFLAAALTIPAAVPVAASESTADKEETVYVKTDANGEEKTVIVSDWLKNFSGEAKIKDATDLTDVDKKTGSTKITAKFKYRGKTYSVKTTVKVIKYSNPFKKIVVDGRDCTSDFKNKNGSGISFMGRNIKITPNKNWRVKSILR